MLFCKYNLGVKSSFVLFEGFNFPRFKKSYLPVHLNSQRLLEHPSLAALVVIPADTITLENFILYSLCISRVSLTCIAPLTREFEA